MRIRPCPDLDIHSESEVQARCNRSWAAWFGRISKAPAGHGLSDSDSPLVSISPLFFFCSDSVPRARLAGRRAGGQTRPDPRELRGDAVAQDRRREKSIYMVSMVWP